MKKVFVCLLLTALLFAAGMPQVRREIREAVQNLLDKQSQQTEGVQRDPLFEQPVLSVTDEMDVTLYYRYGQTDVLGMERARLETGREEMAAHGIVARLIAGPDAVHGKLTGVFPRGTDVISVTESDDTAFVTLSMEFLGRPDGAPEDWEDLAVWQEEAMLRRWLAAQSIVCSLTEGGRYQRVQLYVAETQEQAPQRIPLCYFDLNVTDASVVLAASSRDETAILTPQRTMQMILDGWQRRDWESVYALLCTQEGGQMPTLSAFEAQMRAADATLLTAEVSFGSVDVSGQVATLLLDGAVRSLEKGDYRLIRQSVPLVRVADNWAMRLDTLLTLMRRE